MHVKQFQDLFYRIMTLIVMECVALDAAHNDSLPITFSELMQTKSLMLELLEESKTLLTDVQKTLT